MRVRDPGHRAALFRVVCSAWVPGASLPYLPSHPPLPLPPPLSRSLSLAGWSLCSKSQANLTRRSPLATPSRYITPVSADFMRRDGLGVFQRRCETNSWPEAQRRRRWRACNVTLSPLLVIAVEWPDLTARSAPRPSTVSGSMGGPSCCWPVFKTLPLHAIHITFHLPPPPFVSSWHEPPQTLESTPCN